MRLICYWLMNVRSQKAMRRKKWKWGRNYTYIPRQTLVKRLARQLNMTEEEVKNQIAKERTYILQHSRYY